MTVFKFPNNRVLDRNDQVAYPAVRIAIIHNGSYYHLTTQCDPAIIAYHPDWKRLRDLQPGDLDPYDVVILADRLHYELLIEHKDEFIEVLRSGRTLVVLGVNSIETWLPGITFHERPTNFWWWRHNEDPGLRTVNENHPVWRYLANKAVIWHHHGAYTVEGEVENLVVLDDVDTQDTRRSQEVGAIFFEDHSTYPGRLIATSLDPMFHHGSNFMPGSSRFLYGLLRWVDSLGR